VNFSCTITFIFIPLYLLLYDLHQSTNTYQIVTYKKAKETIHGRTNATIGEPSLTNKPSICQSHTSLTHQVPSLDKDAAKIVTEDTNFSKKIEDYTCNVAPCRTEVSSLEPRQRRCNMAPPRPSTPTLQLRNLHNAINCSCSPDSTLAQSNKLEHVKSKNICRIVLTVTKIGFSKKIHFFYYYFSSLIYISKKRIFFEFFIKSKNY